MNCLNRLEQQGIVKRERGGGKRNPSTHYFFPGLEAQGRQYGCLPNGDQGSLSGGLPNGQGRQYGGLPLDTHGTQNGSRAESVESPKVGNDVDQGRQ